MPVGLYIHIPFCVKKCNYCDFVSFDNRSDMHDVYVSALIKEIGTYKKLDIDTVFIGGGTPSCIAPKHIDSILSACRKQFRFTDDAEVSIEVNPATVNAEKLRIYCNAGVNRISMGVQSMNDDELIALGRLHRSRDVLESYDAIVNAGFTNINLDMISAAPNQSMESLMFTANELCRLSPAHLSAYSLIIEQGTPLYSMHERDELALPNEDAEREMYDYITEFFASQEYVQYEISNFAKPGFECRHNLKYWQCEPYIGFGIAAHSYFNDTRYANASDIDTYISLTKSRKSAVAEKTVLSHQDMISDYIIMGLRLCKGIDLYTFQTHFGSDLLALFETEINRHIKNGFLQIQGGCLAFTRQGINVSNSILCDFV